MSIYVSITCFKYDRELIPTIKSCFENADSDVVIGLHYCGTDDFRDHILENIDDRVRFLYTPLEKHIGIGDDRNKAASMYQNEDYFLQIDSHTNFQPHWDTFLINKFKEAKKEILAKKIILTGSLSEYEYIDGVPVSSNDLKCFRFIKNKFKFGNTIPEFNMYYYKKDMPNDLIYKVENNKFIPASKISAHFMFSDNSFANNLCLPKDIIFWEEELIQAIELIDNGFTLIHPLGYCPLSHLYENIEQNTRSKSLFKVNIISEMLNVFTDYINNPLNENKIKVFEKYSEISMKYGALKDHCYAKEYANLVE